MLADERIKATKAFKDTNQASFKQLTYFLKSYTSAVSKGNPLKQQLHTLEFIVPDDNAGQVGLRRVVCKLGTTGGECQRLVHRSLQGLFKEVGLSPNFLWNETYALPEESLTFEQRKELEDAKLDHTVEQIQRVHRGEKLAKDTHLTYVDENTPINKVHETIAQHATGATAHASPSSPPAPGRTSAAAEAPEPAPAPAAPPASAAAAVAAAAPVREDAADEEDLHSEELVADDEELDADDEELDDVEEAEDITEDLEKMAADIDENLGLLAMSPWMRVGGDMRRGEEERTAQELVGMFNGLFPGMGVMVQQVWEGERDVAKLAGPLKAECEHDHIVIVDGIVAQMLACTKAIEDKYGPPNAAKPVTRKRLLEQVMLCEHVSMAVEASS